MKTILYSFLFLALTGTAQIKGSVIDLNGVKTKTILRLFDGDLTTNFNANNVSETIAFPYESYLILDSITNITDLKYFVANSSQTQGFMVRFLDQNRQQVGTYLNTASVGKYNTWTTLPATRSGVRFIVFQSVDPGIQFDGIMEVQIYGTGIAKAPSIYPAKASYQAPDLGIYAHGINTLGDRINKKDLLGDTLLPKVAKSIRFYWVGTDFDLYPQSYYANLEDAPLNIGRYGYNHSGNLLNTLTRWGLKPMMNKSGGSIKWLDSNTAKKNNSYLGSTPAQDKKYIPPGADPNSAAAWAGLAQQYKQLIQLYGKRKGTTNAVGGDTTTGQGTMDIFEWDNEPGRWWKQDYYHTPRQYYRALKAVYTKGKEADPGSQIYAGALPGIDTVYWKAVYFCHYLESGISSFPADGFNVNMYLNDAGRQQAGYKGLSPESFGILNTMAWLRDFFDRHFGKPLQWTEFGYATDDVSEYDVDAIGNKTDRQIQADWTLRLKAIVQASKLMQKMYYYAYFQDQSPPFNSMSMVRDSNDWKTVVPYPVAYTTAQELYIERNTPWFSEIVKNGGDTGVWVTRKGNLYKVWKGSSNGSTASYSLPAPAKVYKLRYDSYRPDSTTAQTITVDEGMTWALVDATIPPPVTTPADCKTIKAIIKTEYRDSATNKLIRTATATIYLR
jgi:hypothetical protein